MTLWRRYSPQTGDHQSDVIDGSIHKANDGQSHWRLTNESIEPVYKSPLLDGTEVSSGFRLKCAHSVVPMGFCDHIVNNNKNNAYMKRKFSYLALYVEFNRTLYENR